MYLEQRDDSSNTTQDVTAAPYVLPPTGKFDGDDGAWSTFYINTGDREAKGRGQNFRVLISTSTSFTQVPVEADWCTQENCSSRRGVEQFNARTPDGLITDASSTGYQENGQYNLPLPYWWPADSRPRMQLGTINIGLGPTSEQNSPVLANQMVVSGQIKELFMGSFGLGIVDVNTGPSKNLISWLKTYAVNDLTPSRSFSYSAGARYQGANGTPGSVIIGGYDTTRFTGGKSIKAADNSSLIVGVQSITYRPNQGVENGQTSFTASADVGFEAVIDSTLPYLWLPRGICDRFAERFRLEYDEDRNLYTFNESSRSHNRQQAATVTFRIGEGTTNENDAASIALPWAAFDLEGTPPLFDNATRFFPLKRANGTNVLGRAFLQEAYLIVDYEPERMNFTVAQATYTDPMPQARIVPIHKVGWEAPATTETPPPSSSGGGGGGIGGGAIAGIVIGVLAAIGIVGAILWFLRRKKRRQNAYSGKITPPSEIDTMQAGDQVKHRRVSELDSEPPGSPKTTLGGYYSGGEKDVGSPLAGINELDSPPAELYSPPPDSMSERLNADYFSEGAKLRRRDATRESSQGGTPGTPMTPMAELPGDEGQRTEPLVSPLVSPLHSRGPSDTNIDGVLAAHEEEEERRSGENATEAPAGTTGQTVERRPSHVRGLSDTTIQSDSTAVSEPTPEEREAWATPSDEPRRPLSQ